MLCNNLSFVIQDRDLERLFSFQTSGTSVFSQRNEETQPQQEAQPASFEKSASFLLETIGNNVLDFFGARCLATGCEQQNMELEPAERIEEHNSSNNRAFGRRDSAENILLGNSVSAGERESIATLKRKQSLRACFLPATKGMSSNDNRESVRAQRIVIDANAMLTFAEMRQIRLNSPAFNELIGDKTNMVEKLLISKKTAMELPTILERQFNFDFEGAKRRVMKVTERRVRPQNIVSTEFVEVDNSDIGVLMSSKIGLNKKANKLRLKGLL